MADDMYRFATSCCDDRDWCADAVQDAFVALWQKHKEIELSECKGFLFLVVQRRLRDRLRHEKTIAVKHTDLATGKERTLSPDKEYELKDTVRCALGYLTEMQRTILTLHDIEGYDYSEVAKIMGKNYSFVQVNAFRARIKLKEILLKLR